VAEVKVEARRRAPLPILPLLPWLPPPPPPPLPVGEEQQEEEGGEGEDRQVQMPSPVTAGQVEGRLEVYRAVCARKGTAAVEGVEG